MNAVNIGKIVNTRGLRGEVKIVANTHFVEERFGKGAIVYIGESLIKAVICRSYADKGFIFAVFEGMEDINEVEKFKGCDLYADQSEELRLEEDEVLYSDLMQCEVYTDQQLFVGKVVDVLETWANAVLRVKREKDSVLIPFVKAVVEQVDVEAKRIVIKEMEGLL